jgi:hypothetical protein
MRDEDDMPDEYDFSETEGKPNPYVDMPDEEEISTWDYRLIRGEDGMLTVGEVYYNSDNEPVGWILEAATPESESVEEIIMSLKLMLDAAQKPVFEPPKGE